MNAVLLLAFGGPTQPEDIRPFLANVLRGRSVPPERVEEVAHHYEVVGGRSPLNDVAFRQAESLHEQLARDGMLLPVYVGMRNWTPYILDTLREMTAGGMRRAVGIVLAPHRSEASWERYAAAVDSARAAIGPTAPAVQYPGPWHAHPLFIEAAASCIEDRRAAVPEDRRAAAHILFTAHSIPVSMADVSGYAGQVEETARLISERLCHRSWSVAYQSRSGNPGDAWLEPDVCTALRTLASDGTVDVVVAPIGFVCEQVELTYDLDVEARAVASQLGLTFARARAVNDHPAFIRLLAELVRAAAGGAS